MIARLIARACCSAGVTLLAVGCSQDAANRCHVSGTVTFDKNPLREGRIYFDPDIKGGNDGPQGFADIVDGQYDTSKAGGRPGPIGACVARIEGVGKPSEAFPNGVPLFKDFYVPINLVERRTTLDVDVPAKEKFQVPDNLPPAP